MSHGKKHSLLVHRTTTMQPPRTAGIGVDNHCLSQSLMWSSAHCALCLLGRKHVIAIKAHDIIMHQQHQKLLARGSRANQLHSDLAHRMKNQFTNVRCLSWQ
jgi:hypothetical protein